MFGRRNSFVGTNALLCCDRYNWLFSELISNPKQIEYFPFNCWYFDCLSYTQTITAGFLLELIAISAGQLFLPRLFMSSQQLNDTIIFVLPDL